MSVEFRWVGKPDENHLDLRFRVLREGMPRETARYPGVDEDIRTKFIGAFDGSKMVGCATLQYDPKHEANLRIRGMAVEPNYRNRGIGSTIVGMLQDHATKLETGIWCNARIKAIAMYQRKGFKIKSELFEIQQIGLHYEMHWNPDEVGVK
tara:strand:- start:9454 stop:9906 length:453 start_codon:yes stop_codon:yes gene_type:complete